MADLLVSGWSGLKLNRLLHHHFPHARRDDVFFAISMAAVVWEADLAIAQLETAIARARLAEAGADA